MTPEPRPTGFGPLSWLWWPVVMAGWGLCAVVMAAEWALAAPVGLGKADPPSGTKKAPCITDATFGRPPRLRTGLDAKRARR